MWLPHHRENLRLRQLRLRLRRVSRLLALLRSRQQTLLVERQLRQGVAAAQLRMCRLDQLEMLAPLRCRQRTRLLSGERHRVHLVVVQLRLCRHEQ